MQTAQIKFPYLSCCSRVILVYFRAIRGDLDVIFSSEFPDICPHTKSYKIDSIYHIALSTVLNTNSMLWLPVVAVMHYYTQIHNKLLITCCSKGRILSYCTDVTTKTLHCSIVEFWYMYMIILIIFSHPPPPSPFPLPQVQSPPENSS